MRAKHKRSGKMKNVISFLLVIFFVICVAGNNAVANIVNAQEGDFLLFGSAAVKQSHPKYGWQMYLALEQLRERQAKICEPFFGSNFWTWDDSIYPMGERYFWGHIEICCSDRVVDSGICDTVVVLRPTDSMRRLVDIEAMVAIYIEARAYGSYNQPYTFVDIMWLLDYAIDNVDWINEATIDRWSHYGINFNDFNPEAAAQYGPALGTSAHYDIFEPEFWQRDKNCTFALWAAIWGFEIRTGGLRDLFLKNHKAVNAIDCVAPGGAIYFLEIMLDFVEIVAPELAVNNSKIILPPPDN